MKDYKKKSLLDYLIGKIYGIYDKSGNPDEAKLILPHLDAEEMYYLQTIANKGGTYGINESIF